MKTDSELSSIFQLKTTTTSLKSKRAGVAFVVGLLLKANDTQSITITRQGSSGDSFVLCATNEYWEPVPQPSLFEPQPTSPIPLPGELWDATS